MLPNFPSVRLGLALGYQATRYLLGIPGFANHATTMLLGYQDGELFIPSPAGTRLTWKCGADIPESVNLSRCRNLRMVSIRTEGCSERAVTSLATQEMLFRRLESIASHELEFLLIEIGPGLSLMRCRLSVVVRYFERFMPEKSKKGETPNRFLGV